MGSDTPRYKAMAHASDATRLARFGFWLRWSLVIGCLLNISYRLSLLDEGCAAASRSRALLGRGALPELDGGGGGSRQRPSKQQQQRHHGHGRHRNHAHHDSADSADDGDNGVPPNLDVSSRCAVRVEDVSSWAGAPLPPPAAAPFAFPRIIHQTVEDKANISCEALSCMETWMAKNPGYEHRLVDAAERRLFVAAYYPEVLKVYDGLGTNVERADLWRYLALHRDGGVYADSDVRCLQPIDAWNAANGHDADLLLGVVFTDRGGMVTRVNNFIIAATPCHPVMAAMPFTVMSRVTAAAMAGGAVRSERGKGLTAGVVGRTGPVALTATVAEYAERHAAPWPVNATQGLAGERGNLVGRVRLMPRDVMTMGWETAESKISCEAAQALHPGAYVCHQYFGTWKSDYKHRPALTFGPQCTYADLAARFRPVRPASLLK